MLFPYAEFFVLLGLSVSDVIALASFPAFVMISRDRLLEEYGLTSVILPIRSYG